MNYQQIIRETALLFRKSGIPDPENDAALLLSHLTGLHPLALRLDAETVPDPDILLSFQKMIRRRLDRIPLQYITGEAPFYRRVFVVNDSVLIPRPETELLCEWALEILRGKNQPRILDLCCGSGCIGLTLKAERPDADVTLSDLSSDALRTAKENADKLSVSVAFHLGDLLEGFEAHSFDLIISNPPYVPSADCLHLQPEVLSEPLIALDGGPDGLDLYRSIIRDAFTVLIPGGRLMMECGENQAAQLTSLLASHRFPSVEIRKDFAGIDRMILASLP